MTYTELYVIICCGSLLSDAVVLVGMVRVEGPSYFVAPLFDSMKSVGEK